MITDADLDYLRNINTRPGPNAGQSIDPTKPGPTADRIAEPGPQDVREAFFLPLAENILTGLAATHEVKERCALAWGLSYQKEWLADELGKAFSALRVSPALAQSDAQPAHHAAGQDYWRRSRAADAQSDAQPIGTEAPNKFAKGLVETLRQWKNDGGGAFYLGHTEAIAYVIERLRPLYTASPFLPEGAREAWRFDIDNAPEYPDACWVGDSKSGVHIVCRRGQRNMRGVWYIAWANKMLPWLPDCWMPIPPSPPLRSRAANRSAT